jgi:hypothetical protein
VGGGLRRKIGAIRSQILTCFKLINEWGKKRREIILYQIWSFKSLYDFIRIRNE